ncbi:MAG: RNA polymerase sigma factor WhiG [Acidimicrobiia bacterium]
MPKAKPDKTSKVKTTEKKAAVSKSAIAKKKAAVSKGVSSEKKNTKKDLAKKSVNVKASQEKILKEPAETKPKSKAKIKAEEIITKQVATIKNRRVVSELWSDYGKDPSSDSRDRLILHYSPLVKFVASRVASGLPQNIEQTDLMSYGIFGLIDAIEKFQPERGFKFETYAISRIKGAIIDELRTIDWVPRSLRAKARALERAYSSLESDLKRTPEDSEIAKAMGISMDDLNTMMAQISFVGLVALDEVIDIGGDRGNVTTIKDTLPANSEHDPVVNFEVDEMKQLLADSINRMPDRERLVLTLYYYEGLTLAEIGDVLEVTESRVCQIHTKAILQLKSRLAEPPRVS